MACGSVFGEGLNLGQHRGQRFDACQVHIEPGAAGAAQVGVGVVESRKDVGAGVGRVQVAQAGIRPGEPGDLLCCAHGQHFAAADGHGLDGFGLILRQPDAGVDDAVEEDDFGHYVERGRLHAFGRCVLGSGSLSGAE